MKPPSLVRYSFTSGLVELRWCWWGRVSVSSTLVPGDRHAHRPQADGHQRDVDDRRLTGALAVEQRRADAAGERHPRLQVAEARAGHGERNGCVGRRHAERGARTSPVRDPVETTSFRQLAAGALGAAAGVDDAGVPALDVLGFDAQLAAGGREEVGDEDVGLVDELHQDRLDLRAWRASRAIARLPRLVTSHRWDTPLTSAGTPHAAVARPGSPSTGCSTLSTSAPQSARIAAADGREGVDRHLQDPNSPHRCRHRSAVPIEDQNIMRIMRHPIGKCVNAGPSAPSPTHGRRDAEESSRPQRDLRLAVEADVPADRAVGGE